MIYLYHIRKTGGRSVVRAYLNQFATGKDLEVLWSRCHGRSGQVGPIVEVQGKRIAPWHANPPHDVDFAWAHVSYNTPQLPPTARKMTILRDPVQRFISLYRNMLRVKQYPSTELMSRYGRWLGKDVVETAKNTPSSYRYEILSTFSPTLQIDEAKRNIEDLWFYFKLEEFEDGLQVLRELTGMPFPYHHYRDRLDGHAVQSLVAQELTPEVLSTLVGIFEPEYRLLESFGYVQP